MWNRLVTGNEVQGYVPRSYTHLIDVSKVKRTTNSSNRQSQDNYLFPVTCFTDPLEKILKEGQCGWMEKV